MTQEAPVPVKVTDEINLRGAWKNFVGLLAEPWNALLLIGVGFLFVISQQKMGATSSALVQVMLTVGSGVLGGRLAQKMASMTEGSVLRARGRSAVRSLKLLLRNTSALEARVSEFLLKREHIDSQPEVTVRNYEEIVGFCRLLQEETVSSIENWTDIVSEADISSIMGVISDLKATIDSKQEELAQLKIVQEASEELSGERDRLAIELSSKTAELITLRGQLQRAATGISNGKASGGVNRLAGLRGLGLGALGGVSGGLSIPPLNTAMIDVANAVETSRSALWCSKIEDDTTAA